MNIRSYKILIYWLATIKVICHLISTEKYFGNILTLYQKIDLIRARVKSQIMYAKSLIMQYKYRPTIKVYWFILEDLNIGISILKNSELRKNYEHHPDTKIMEFVSLPPPSPIPTLHENICEGGPLTSNRCYLLQFV